MSVCTSLTTQLRNLTQLHSDLEEILESLDQEVTPQKLAQAHQLKELIKQTTKELKPTFDTGVEQVLKEKWDFDFEQQLEIYSECKQTEWVTYLSDPQNKSIVLKKFLNPENRASIEAKRAEGMKPYLMPGRDIQQENLKKSLKYNLQPYWRESEKEQDGIVLISGIWDSVYDKFMDTGAAWTDIPQEPYIVWSNPTQKVDPTTMNIDVQGQIKYILARSRDEYGQPSLLYDKRELGPVEYAVLQTMYTRIKKRQSDQNKTNEDILPLDYMHFETCPELFSSTSFPIFGLPFDSQSQIPHSFFSAYHGGNMTYNTHYVTELDNFGFRWAGRL